MQAKVKKDVLYWRDLVPGPGDPKCARATSEQSFAGQLEQAIPRTEQLHVAVNITPIMLLSTLFRH